jgi:hypothetical protein
MLGCRHPGEGEAMNFKPILFLAIAIGLWFVSHSLELRGDAAPMSDGGVFSERAGYHIAALALLLGALGCFIYAGVSAFRRWRG